MIRMAIIRFERWLMHMLMRIDHPIVQNAIEEARWRALARVFVCRPDDIFLVT